MSPIRHDLQAARLARLAYVGGALYLTTNLVTLAMVLDSVATLTAY